jgi:N-acetylglucosamine kinase-like BadF-type ATPase
LFDHLKTAWKLESLEQLARSANSSPDFAGLFPAVLSASGAGDVQAQRVLAQAGMELAKLGGIVLRRLFPELPPSVSSPIPLAVAGGVFRHAPRVREVFYNEVRAAHSRVVCNSGVLEPVHGALRRARRPSF